MPKVTQLRVVQLGWERRSSKYAGRGPFNTAPSSYVLPPITATVLHYSGSDTEGDFNRSLFFLTTSVSVMVLWSEQMMGDSSRPGAKRPRTRSSPSLSLSFPMGTRSTLTSTTWSPRLLQFCFAPTRVTNAGNVGGI